MANEPDLNPMGEDPKLASLEERLRAARQAESERTAPPASNIAVTGAGGRRGEQVLSILVGYPIGGGVVGWLLDGWLHTRPWIMLVLLFLGFAAACRQVFRISKGRED